MIRSQNPPLAPAPLVPPGPQRCFKEMAMSSQFRIQGLLTLAIIGALALPFAAHAAAPAMADPDFIAGPGDFSNRPQLNNQLDYSTPLTRELSRKQPRIQAE